MEEKEKQKEILKKVRFIDLKTRKAVNELFGGEYHSVFKGRGMNFSQVREYSYGDDIRAIDWNVTARMRKPFVKIFEEERELILMLIVDISASGMFGSVDNLKREISAEIAALLAFSAVKNNDKVGLILFSDKIEKFIPPKKGRSHVFRIIRELLFFKAESKGTSIESALEFLNNIQKKKAISFVISDFLDSNYEKGLQIVAKKHDLIAIDIFDKREHELPEKGVYEFYDNESGKRMLIDLSSRSNREAIKENVKNRIAARTKLFRKNKVENISMDINKPYIEPLIGFFRKRKTKR
ncbi:MAG TPA: DUF58 domain-containing protein [Clostridiales bacterium]|nr:DUF58 domain-containing protein [Clostridiales bacterium]HQP69792.1 DUF58 domain-containing protein [Clostridiales bacterium]